MRPAILVLALAALALSSSAQVKITPGAEKIAIEINGKPFSDFYVAGKEVSKPYLWPLCAATGTYITRMWPMEKVAEEFDGDSYKGAKNKKPDHQHQRGMWFAHDSVINAAGQKLDFWNNEFSYQTPNRGRIALKKLGEIKSGKDQGSVTATFEWSDMDGSKPPLLTETRVMTFYGSPDTRTFDLDITLTALQKVTFGDGKDGVLGVRLRPILQEDLGTGHISNADGLVGEKALWGKPSNWCDYSGEINGEKVGIAILDHPSNPNHPVRWHARAYGLFAANPFGLSVFTNDKSKIASMTLEAGQSARFRYRIVIHPGDPQTAHIAAVWASYK
jgi:hypothetical protein